MLAICLPCQGTFSRQTVEALLSLRALLVSRNIPHSILTQEGSHIDRVRNELTARFLASPHRYSLWIDSDVGGELVAFVERCLAKGLEFGCAAYRVKQDVVRYNINHIDGAVIDGEGYLPVSAAGAGCLWIAREVFEALRHSCDPYTPYHGSGVPDGQECFNWWASGVRNGRYLSEDYALCKLANEAGFDLLLDTTITLTHTGRKTW